MKMAEEFKQATVILIDIAGTSSSINFVQETLFPYVIKHSESFLTKNWDETDVKEIVKSLQENDAEIAKEGEKEVIIKSLVAAIKKLTEDKSELKELKKFQGLVYLDGYKSGNLKGFVYPDVAVQLPKWSSSKKRVCVYSTGSKQSQQSLFAHSTEGDLSKYIAKYFDQSIGLKTESNSYKSIAEQLEAKVNEILFLTDSVKEANAAKEAGLMSALVVREGNEELSTSDKEKFATINSFADLMTETTEKRKMVDDEENKPEAPPTKLAKTESETVETTSTTAVVENNSTEVTSNVEEKMEVDTAVAETETEKKSDESKDVTSDADAVTSTTEPAEETAPKTETKEEPAKLEKETLPETEKEETNEVVNNKTESNETKTESENKETEEKTAPVVTANEETKPEAEKQPEVNSTKNDVTDSNETETKTDKSVELKTDAETEPEKDQIDNDKKELTPIEEEKAPAEENGEVVNGDGSEKKDTKAEKENKSELANGAHTENGDEKLEKKDESEIKVKKIEAESSGNENVTVEVNV